jgi:hypothetical protein
MLDFYGLAFKGAFGVRLQGLRVTGSYGHRVPGSWGHNNYCLGSIGGIINMNAVMAIGLYPKHFIFFASYKWVK